MFASPCLSTSSAAFHSFPLDMTVEIHNKYAYISIYLNIYIYLPLRVVYNALMNEHGCI
jgi:hypothetical protein